MYGKISACVLLLLACVLVSIHLNTLIFLRSVFVTTVNKTLHIHMSMFVIMLYYFVFIFFIFVFVYNDYSHGFVQFCFFENFVVHCKLWREFEPVIIFESGYLTEVPIKPGSCLKYIYACIQISHVSIFVIIHQHTFLGGLNDNVISRYYPNISGKVFTCVL